MHGLTVVFDLDGTSSTPHPISPAPPTTSSPTLAVGAARRDAAAVGQPWARRMITEALAQSRNPPAAAIDELLERFLAFYSRNIAQEPALRRRGCRARPPARARHHAGGLHQQARGAVAIAAPRAAPHVVFRGDCRARHALVSKPHPDHLIGAIRLRRRRSRPRDHDGDSAVDIAAARRGGPGDRRRFGQWRRRCASSRPTP